jgi:hypothetical protein
MASRSLGTLTLDVVAQIGGYTAGLDKAEKEAKKRAAAIEKAFDGAFNLITAGFAAVGAAGVAALAAVNAQAETIANYQDLAEKIGDTAENITTLQKAATISGTAMESVAAASVKLTASLAKTDDESKAVGQAIQALGLNFEEFKNLSPVEQIDAVAKSLAGFANGAEKTAVAVALFGKSGAELLPFLNDLGDQAERQITLTAEQIKQANDYVEAQAALKAEFDIFIQQQASELIPTLTQVQETFAEIAKNETVVEGVTKAVAVAVQAAIIAFQAIVVVASDVIFVFKGVGTEIGGILAQLAALARFDLTGFNAISQAMKEDAQRARAELDKFQKQVMSIGQPAFVDDEIRRLQARSASAQPVRPRLNIAGLATGGGGGGGARRGGGGGAAKDPFAEAARYLESLQKQLERTQDLTVAEQALLEIQSGRLGKVTEAQKESILETARQIDATKALEEQEKANNKAAEEQLRLRQQLVQEGEKFTEQFLTPQEKNAKAIENVNRLLDEGVISIETAARAIQSYRKEVEESNKAVEEFDEFTKNAIKGSQDAIAGFLENLATGSKQSFKDIANDFAAMLVKLAAQSLAADLTKKLFGAAGGGEGGGWASLFSGLFGGARALGGPVIGGRMYQVNERGPEVFQAANGNQYMMAPSNGTVIPNGGMNQTVNVNIVGTPDPRTPTQIAQEVRRQTNTASRRFG